MSFTDRLGLSIPKAIAAWLLVLLIGGIAGLFAMLLCNYVLSFGGGVDSANKHGISKVSASRVGGLAIVTYMLMHLGYQFQLGVYEPELGDSIVMMVCIAFFALGIYEDLHGTLSARARILVMLVIALATLSASPDLVLLPVGIGWVDSILSASSLVALAFTGICIAFIPNAFNTADGANGLIAGTAVFSLAGLTYVTDATIVPLITAAMVGCLIFLVFNLGSGRFFLGDGGAYFLGALCGLGLIVASNGSDVSVWWLLSLVFYPVADLIWSIGRRILASRSPFTPDNQHLHNLLFASLDAGEMSSMTANTLTGVSIAVMFSGTPVLMAASGFWSVTDDIWLFWVLVQWLLYGLFWKYLSDRLCALPALEGET